MSALEPVLAQMRTDSDETPPFGDRDDPDQGAERGREETSSLFVRGGKFILDQPEGVPAVWGRENEVLWAPGESLMIVGPTGVGKTTLAWQLVRGRTGLCDEVLGFPIEAGERRTLYLACDRPSQIARVMRRSVSEADRAVLDDRLLVWRGPPPADLAKHPERRCRSALGYWTPG